VALSAKIASPAPATAWSTTPQIPPIPATNNAMTAMLSALAPVARALAATASAPGSMRVRAIEGPKNTSVASTVRPPQPRMFACR
jgi:hypothetical protein